MCVSEPQRFAGKTLADLLGEMQTTLDELKDFLHTSTFEQTVDALKDYGLTKFHVARLLHHLGIGQ